MEGALNKISFSITASMGLNHYGLLSYVRCFTRKYGVVVEIQLKKEMSVEFYK